MKAEQSNEELAQVKQAEAAMEETEKAQMQVSSIAVNKSDQSDVIKDLSVRKSLQKGSATVSKYDCLPVDRADEYSKVREKYGFSSALTANRNIQSDATSTDEGKKPATEEDKAASRKATDEINSVIVNETAEVEEQGKTGQSSKHEEVTENQYIYSESSKEFKLLSANESATVEGKTADSIQSITNDPNASKTKADQQYCSETPGHKDNYTPVKSQLACWVSSQGAET